MEKVKPEVGMGATMGVGSDRYPYTIVKISKSGKKLWATADNYKPAEGYDYFGNQVYEYTPMTDRPALVFTLRKNGRWVQQGQPKRGGIGLGIGHREAYSDPSF